MERTKLFVAIVKTIRLKEKDGKSNLEKIKAKPETLFLKEAQELYIRIRKLQEFLISSRMDYIDTMGFLGSKTVMKDDERDRIDIEVKEFLQACMSQANRVKNLISSGSSINESVSVTLGPQLRTHRTMVCESLDDLLKGTCKMYDDQKSVRVNRMVNRKKLGRLHHRTNASKCDKKADPVSEVVQDSASDNGLSIEEKNKFSIENDQLFVSMNSMSDELRMIEGKVVEISKLQELFAENVLHQAKTVEDIADKTEESQENISEGNEQIRKAIKNKATLRIWILFILLVFSFALLFLDWYS